MRRALLCDRLLIRYGLLLSRRNIVCEVCIHYSLRGILLLIELVLVLLMKLRLLRLLLLLRRLDRVLLLGLLEVVLLRGLLLSGCDFGKELVEGRLGHGFLHMVCVLFVDEHGFLVGISL